MNSLARGALSTSGLAKYERPRKKQFPINSIEIQMKRKEMKLDGRVRLFSAWVPLLTGVLLGLAPTVAVLTLVASTL